MLVEFQVTNFKSFRDTQRLSMVASADTSLPENTIETEALGKQRLLRSAVVYGANAAGKSNLIAALEFMKYLVTRSDQRDPGSSIPVPYFRLDPEYRDSTSSFEATFIHNEVRYQYGFIIDQRCVREEWLIAYPKGLPQRWFARTLKEGQAGYEWQFSTRLRGQKRRLEELTRPDVLFLTVASRFNQRQLSEVYQWFVSNLDIIVSLHNYPRVYEEVSAMLAAEEDTFQLLMKSLLRVSDLGITDFSIEEKPSLNDAATARVPIDSQSPSLRRSNWDVRFLHEADYGQGDGAYFSLEEESLGTQRLFGIGGPLLLQLFNGGVLCIDEIDASLHPLLVKALVRLFHEPVSNRRKAQLIFNTHDTTLLDSGLFRRDQIWFVEKDNSGASHLYPLLDYSPRKDEALARGYLRGRYGAIPFLSDSLQGLIPDAQK